MGKDERGQIPLEDLVDTHLDPLPPATPERIGPYRILHLIGSGGMGDVHEAEQTAPVRRRVALKLIRLGMDSQQVLARFETERQALALMNHTNIARVYDAGISEQGRSYFAMELVKGVAITDYCDRHRLTPRRRLELFVHVCEGVQHAHQKGVIHRDIKPSNVLVTIQDDKSIPKIIDFGVAKATDRRLTDKTCFTEYGQLIGTPEYMSPEQAEMSSLDVDTRTDVYSLGVLMYELLVGVLPFDDGTLRRGGIDEVRRRIREQEPPRPSTRLSSLGGKSADLANRCRTAGGDLARLLRGDLDCIVMKAMEKDRTRRYASASEMAADVQRHLRHEPVLASPPSRLYRMRKFARRHRAGVGFAAVLLLLLTGFAATMAVQAERIARERDRAGDQARAAREVSAFLIDLFRAPDARANTDRLTAREILDQGAERIRGGRWSRPLTRAELMHTMGQTYLNLRVFDEARTALEDALRIRRHEAGPGDPSVADTLNDLANLHADVDDLARARELHEEALAIREAALGAEHEDVAESLNNLANVLAAAGDYSRALTLHERALAIRMRALGPEHEQTARSLNNVAIFRQIAGDYSGAREMLERALGIVRATLGRRGPATAAYLRNLAFLALLEGDERAAGRLYDEALEIQTDAWGADHPDVALALAEVALHDFRRGEAERGQARYASAIETLDATIGLDNRLVLFYQARHAALAGDSDEALGLLERSVVDKGFYNRPDLDRHPDLVSLHGEPRFDALLDVVEGRARRP